MLLLGILSLALVSEPPEDWTKQSRYEDEENFYYVGISSPSNDDRRAYEEAYQMTLRSLVLEHFGRDLRFQERVFQDLDEVHADQQIELGDANVRLRGLKILDEDWTESSNSKILRILVAYPRKERDQELKRQSLDPTLPTKPLNKYRGRNHGGSAELHIVTNPPEAEVYLDGNLIGKSSLLASGLKEGSFQLEIRSRDFETHQSRVLLSPGVKTEVDVQLKKKKGTIDLSTIPEDATVEFIDTSLKFRGSKTLTLEAGEYRVRIAHPDFLERTESIYIEGDSQSFRSFELSPRPDSDAGLISSKSAKGAPVYVRIKSDSYPVELIFFNGSHYRKYGPISETSSKTLKLPQTWTYVVASSPGQVEIAQALEMAYGKTTEIELNFLDQPKDPRFTPVSNYWAAEEIQIYSNLYPLRIRFIDATKMLDETVKGNQRSLKIKYPYRFYEAYGPNGEEAKGVIDYRLVPLRVHVEFKPSEQTKGAINEQQASVRTQQTKKILLWIAILGGAALGAWAGYELAKSKDGGGSYSGSNGTSRSGGGIRIGGY